jgi:hemoglobin
MSTLYEKLGGEAAISAVVDKFYEFMLKDDSVSHFFANIDMSKQRCRQKQFITLVTGGPHNYEGADMKTAHCKLNIFKTHFDVTWKHLEEALLHFSVPVILVDEVKAIFYSVEGDIVRQPPASTCPFGQIENKEKPKGCPFKSKVSKPESEAAEENCPLRLSNNAYMKDHY